MNENSGEALSISQKLKKIAKNRLGPKEAPRLEIDIAPEARTKLRALVLRDNPTLAEFAFLGIGKGRVVEEIWTADEVGYSDNSGLLKSGRLASSVDSKEWEVLFERLARENRLRELLLLGHTHPSGTATIGGIKYEVPSSSSLLDPSGGEKTPSFGGDVKWYKSFLEMNPNVKPNAAIAANTPDGPQVKIFDMEKLVQIRKYREVDSVPQITLQL